MVEGAELGDARTDPRDFGCNTRNQRHRIVPIGTLVQGIFSSNQLTGIARNKRGITGSGPNSAFDLRRDRDWVRRRLHRLFV